MRLLSRCLPVVRWMRVPRSTLLWTMRSRLALLETCRIRRQQRAAKDRRVREGGSRTQQAMPREMNKKIVGVAGVGSTSTRRIRSCTLIITHKMSMKESYPRADLFCGFLRTLTPARGVPALPARRSLSVRQRSDGWRSGNTRRKLLRPLKASANTTYFAGDDGRQKQRTGRDALTHPTKAPSFVLVLV
jgi:hypothetical protein